MRASLIKAVVLHQRDYLDHHVIIDFMSREHGRISLMARGLRGKKSRRAGVLQPFAELLISFSGRGDLPLLGQVEDAGNPPHRFTGVTLLCALYINELLLRLLPVHDPHPEVYDAYLCTLNGFTRDSVVDQLRRFEVNMVDELGYGLLLSHDSNESPIEPDQRYRYDPESGAHAVSSSASGHTVVQGSTLLALSCGVFVTERDRTESRRLMSAVIDHLLDGRVLNTRELLKSYYGKR